MPGARRSAAPPGLLLPALAAALACATPPETRLAPPPAEFAPELPPSAAVEEPIPAAPLEGTLHVGLAWVEDWPSDPEPYLGDVDELRRQQEEVLRHFERALASAPVERVVWMRRRAGEPPAGPEEERARLLRAAAAEGLDVVVILRTRSTEAVETNPVGALYVLLLLNPVLPGFDLAVATRVRACALDVPEGRLLACTAGTAAAGDRFVMALRRRARHRELRASALGRAMDEAGRALGRELERLTHLAPALGRAGAGQPGSDPGRRESPAPPGAEAP